jgi:hypothetical protein
MNDVDPDVLLAVKAISVTREGTRKEHIKQKHSKQLEARFETQIELLIDEVERVVPRTHPDFMTVLALAVVRKVAKQAAEPEFKSFLGEGIPNGW